MQANRRRSLVSALYLSTGRLIVAYTAHMHAYSMIAQSNPAVRPFLSFEPDSCLCVWAGECEKDLAALFVGEYYGGTLSCTAVEFDRTLRADGLTLPMDALAFWRGVHEQCERILCPGEGFAIGDLHDYLDANFSAAVSTYYDIKHGIFDRKSCLKQPERNLNL